ncbi:MAG: hypothetical protein R3B09_06070 [Nannocystaceae bacterium]
MAKTQCRPNPEDLRVFRLDGTVAGQRFLNYVVPEGRVLILNSWVVGRMNSNITPKLLRNADIVAERAQASDQSFVLNLLFPTGIAFFAGDTMTLDSGNNGTVFFLYGYEEDV